MRLGVPDPNLAEHFVDRHLREERSEKTAVICGDRCLTYAGVADQVNRTGNYDVYGINEAAVIVRNLAEVQRRVIAAARVVFSCGRSRKSASKPEEMVALGSSSNTALGFMVRQERIFTFRNDSQRAASALSNTSGWHRPTA